MNVAFAIERFRCVTTLWLCVKIYDNLNVQKYITETWINIFVIKCVAYMSAYVYVDVYVNGYVRTI